MLLGLYRVKVGSKSEYDVDLQIKDELEQLLEDDEDMAELYLSRKLAGASSPAIDSGEHINWYPTSPTIGAKISRAKSHLVRSATVRGDDKNDVEEVEMLLEVVYCMNVAHIYIFTDNHLIYFVIVLQAHFYANRQNFEQINRGTVSSSSFFFFVDKPLEFWTFGT